MRFFKAIFPLKKDSNIVKSNKPMLNAQDGALVDIFISAVIRGYIETTNVYQSQLNKMSLLSSLNDSKILLPMKLKPDLVFENININNIENYTADILYFGKENKWCLQVFTWELHYSKEYSSQVKIFQIPFKDVCSMMDNYPNIDSIIINPNSMCYELPNSAIQLIKDGKLFGTI